MPTQSFFTYDSESIGLAPGAALSATEPLDAATPAHGHIDTTLSAAQQQVQLLWQWADAAWLRRMDAAFAQWLVAGDPQCHAALPLVAAILSALEGRGHSCLALSGLHDQLGPLLDWPAESNAQHALSLLKAQLPSCPADWQRVLHSAMIAPASAEQGTADVAAAPLVLVSNAQHQPARLYLRRYYLFEQVTASGLLARVQVGQAVAGEVDAAGIARILGLLFPTDPAPHHASDAIVPPNWQKIACALALRQRLGVITGGPGTGKTYTAARLMAAALALAADPAAVRIRLAAPTGKAAARLSESLQLALQELPDAIRGNAALHQALVRIPAARTLHALLGATPGTRALRHHAGNPLALDWLIVDEASMVDLEMMANLLQALPPHAHLVLLGDKDQLDSVEAGAVLGDVCEDAQQGHYSAATADYLMRSCGAPLPPHYQHAQTAAPALSQAIAMLRVSRRFGGMIGQLALAVQANNAPQMAVLMAQLQQQAAAERAVYWKEQATVQDAQIVAWGTDRQPAAAGYARLASGLKAMPPWPAAYQRPHTLPPALEPQWQARHAAWVLELLAALAHFRILCATRKGPWGVEGMNELVIQALREAGLPAKQQGWFVGRVVMVTRNDASLGIFNGDVGIALPAAHNRQQLRVFFPGLAVSSSTEPEGAAPAEPVTRSIAVSRLQHAQTAYAMTVHKSQGSEFAHVMLCLPGHDSPLLTRELLYTGLTRAKQHFSYLSPRVGAWQQAMAQSTLRTSGLVPLLYGNALQEQGAA